MLTRLVMFLGTCHVTVSKIIFIPLHPILFHYGIAFFSRYIPVMLYCSRSTSTFSPCTSFISRKKQRSGSSSPLYCTYSTCPRIASHSVFVSLGTANTPLSFHTTATHRHLNGVSFPTESHRSSHQLDFPLLLGTPRQLPRQLATMTIIASSICTIPWGPVPVKTNGSYIANKFSSSKLQFPTDVITMMSMIHLGTFENNTISHALFGFRSLRLLHL